MNISVQPRREEAIKAGFTALQERLPQDIDFDLFRERLGSWDVKAFCRGEDAVGMLMVKGSELHVAVIPEVRGKWLSRRLIREVLSPLIRSHGEAVTTVMPENEVGNDFIKRLGFDDSGDVAVLREGFTNLVFDPVTAVIGAGASLFGSAMQADAAQSAASTQAGAADRAAATQLGMFNTVNAQQAPWRQSGQNALAQIEQMQPQFTRSFGAPDLQSNLAPNYQFQLDQGLGAIKNAGNLQTGLISGNTLKGINDYAQNFAGNAYQQAFNNFNAQQTNIFNRLSNIAGLGQTANQTTASAGVQSAGNAGNAMIAGGAGAAAGTVGAANAMSGGLQNAASWYSLPSFLGTGSQAATSSTPWAIGSFDSNIG